MDLALNNLQRLICHKIQQTQPRIFYKTINVIHLHVVYSILSTKHLIKKKKKKINNFQCSFNLFTLNQYSNTTNNGIICFY